jgi:hypothetical protein
MGNELSMNHGEYSIAPSIYIKCEESYGGPQIVFISRYNELNIPNDEDITDILKYINKYNADEKLFYIHLAQRECMPTDIIEIYRSEKKKSGKIWYLGNGKVEYNSDEELRARLNDIFQIYKRDYKLVIKEVEKFGNTDKIIKLVKKPVLLEKKNNKRNYLLFLLIILVILAIAFGLNIK